MHPGRPPSAATLGREASEGGVRVPAADGPALSGGDRCEYICTRLLASPSAGSRRSANGCFLQGRRGNAGVGFIFGAASRSREISFEGGAIE